ncbi:hypothetical protein ACFE04_011548 [Oxalis oulophora]
MPAKRERRSAKVLLLEEEVEDKKVKKVISDDDDDDEANEDLSLKIIEKSLKLRDATVKSANSKIKADNDILENESGVLRVQLSSKENGHVVGDSKRKKVKTVKKNKKTFNSLADGELKKEGDDEEKIVKKSAIAKKTAKTRIEKVGDCLKENKESGVANDEPFLKTDVGDVGVSKKKKVKKIKKANKKSLPIDNLEPNISVVEAAVEDIKDEIADIVQSTDTHLSTVQISNKKDEDIADIVQCTDIDSITVPTSNNLVMRKLLRGPRYFDPPDSGNWETCFHCGEEGHLTVNCTSEKRKKPCFVCGSLEHGVKECEKAQDCYICKKGGHRARDCPDKYKKSTQNDRICLKCLGSGHDIFSCYYEYSTDDLKEIQCYVCKSFGHLSCGNLVDPSSREPSCYRCGQLGHSGLACGRLKMEDTGFTSLSSCYICGEGGHFARECYSASTKSKGLHGETSEKKVEKPRGENSYVESSCFKCGQEGHWMRECSSSAKIEKRKFEFPSSPAKKYHKDNRNHSGSKSAPHDNHYKRKHFRYEDDEAPRKRGWIMDDPEDFPRHNYHHDWSPSTQYRKHHNNYNSGSHHHVSSHNGSSYHHRHSASKNGNSYYGDDKRWNNYNSRW